MIPQSLGAILAFLGLVAPGIFFENLRNRRRPGQGESTFREISRIALSSFLLSLVSASLILANRLWIPGRVVDPRLWVDQGSRYVRENYLLVACNLLAALALAFLIATLLNAFLVWRKRGTGSIAWHNVWYEEFRLNVPSGTHPWVHVRLTNGDSYYGFVKSYTESGKPEDREITLEGPGLTEVRYGTDGTKTETNSGKTWESVVISGPEIRYIRVQYVDDLTGEIVLTNRRKEAIARAEEAKRKGPQKTDSLKEVVPTQEIAGSE